MNVIIYLLLAIAGISLVSSLLPFFGHLLYMLINGPFYFIADLHDLHEAGIPMWVFQLVGFGFVGFLGYIGHRKNHKP